MPKPSFKKNSSGTIKPLAERIRGLHTFPMGICPKRKLIERLEYELADYDSAVHHFNHYTTRVPPFLWGHSSDGYSQCNLSPIDRVPNAL